MLSVELIRAQTWDVCDLWQCIALSDKKKKTMKYVFLPLESNEEQN